MDIASTTAAGPADETTLLISHHHQLESTNESHTFVGDMNDGDKTEKSALESHRCFANSFLFGHIHAVFSAVLFVFKVLSVPMDFYVDAMQLIGLSCRSPCALIISSRLRQFSTFRCITNKLLVKFLLAVVRVWSCVWTWPCKIFMYLFNDSMTAWAILYVVMAIVFIVILPIACVWYIIRLYHRITQKHGRWLGTLRFCIASLFQVVLFFILLWNAGPLLYGIIYWVFDQRLMNYGFWCPVNLL